MCQARKQRAQVVSPSAGEKLAATKPMERPEYTEDVRMVGHRRGIFHAWESQGNAGATVRPEQLTVRPEQRVLFLKH